MRRNTDNQGPRTWGWRLSKPRAQAVADHLVKQGVPRHRLVVEWFADQRPTASNNPHEGHRANRRVDVSYNRESE